MASSGRKPAVQVSSNPFVSGGWLPPLMLVVIASAAPTLRPPPRGHTLPRIINLNRLGISVRAGAGCGAVALPERGKAPVRGKSP